MNAILSKSLPLFGAVLGAFLIYIIADFMTKRVFAPKASKRVKDMTGMQERNEEPTIDFGSDDYKIRLAFSSLKIDVSGYESLAVNVFRLVAGLVFVFVMNVVLGLPLITSLVGFLGGILMINSFTTGAWRNMCNEINKEIPIFLSGFTSTIQVSPNVLQAIEEEADVLQEGSKLQWWLRNRFLKLGQEKNIAALEELTIEAFRVSTSLGSMVFLVGRMWRTGGIEWQRAFTLAASNLEGVMEARILGMAAGNAAKNSVKLIIGVTLVVTLVLARNPVFEHAMKEPIVQIVYALSTLMMIFGYGVMGDMIDNLL